MVRKWALAILFGFGIAGIVGYRLMDWPTDRKLHFTDMVSVGESGPLDGMVFVGDLGPEGRPKDVADIFVFSDGTFVSKECELRCDYPARPYFIRDTVNGIEFASRTKCPYKDAEITWRGFVEEGRIAGTATWTIRRWYWTMTNTFEFAGTLGNETDYLAYTRTD